MGYLVVQAKLGNSSLSQKKKYINSLFSTFTNSNVKSGFFNKFSKALGFKEEDKFTPEDILVENFFVYHDKECFMEFYFPEKGYLHGSEVAISYSELAEKWKNFLNKVFPQLSLETTVKEKTSSEEIFLISTILKVVEDYPISTSVSLSKKMDSETLETLKTMIESLKLDLNYEIEQYYCNTCFSNDSNNPIHLEFQTSWNPK